MGRRRVRRPVIEKDRLKPEFADAKLTIRLANSSLAYTEISYPLEHVVAPWGPEDSRRVSVSIPAVVDPSQFPNDTYVLDLQVGISPPPGLVVRSPLNASGGTVAVFDLPVVFGIARDDRLGRWNLGTDKVVASGGRSSSSSRAYFQPVAIRAAFTRGWPYWAFIYAVSLMPAVIGLSFFVRTRRRRGASANDTSAAMELAAALLALIALRQVFVPTDITGLTRLDFILGVQLLAVCWLMAVTYVAEPPPAPSVPTPPRPRGRRRRLAPRVPDGAIRPR